MKLHQLPPELLEAILFADRKKVEADEKRMKRKIEEEERRKLLKSRYRKERKERKQNRASRRLSKLEAGNENT